MITAKALYASARLRSLPLSVSGVLLGSGAAYGASAFRADIFALALLTTLLFQVLSDYANDYGDAVKGTDDDGRLGPRHDACHRGLLAHDLRDEDLPRCGSGAAPRQVAGMGVVPGDDGLRRGLIRIGRHQRGCGHEVHGRRRGSLRCRRCSGDHVMRGGAGRHGAHRSGNGLTKAARPIAPGCQSPRIPRGRTVGLQVVPFTLRPRGLTYDRTGAPVSWV